MKDKVIMIGENGEKIELYIEESTRLQGKDYILAADVAAGDGECYILEDISDGDGEESVYQFVEDEKKLDYLIGVFAELLDDVDLEG